MMLLMTPTTIPRQRVPMTTATAGSNCHSFDHSARDRAAPAEAARSLSVAGNETAPVRLARTAAPQHRRPFGPRGTTQLTKTTKQGSFLGETLQKLSVP